VIGTAMLLALGLFAVVGGRTWRHSYRTLGYDQFADPSGDHPFGTDRIGADMLAQVMRGTWHSLPVALGAAVLAGGVGVVLLLLAAHLRRGGHGAIGRVVDLVLLLGPVAMVAALMTHRAAFGIDRYGYELSQVTPILFLIGWLVLAALLRAVRGRGWPTTADLVIVNVVLAVCFANLYQPRLRLMGYGPQIPEFSLAQQLTFQRSQLDEHWWLYAAPFAFLVLVPLAIYFVAVGLRDAITSATSAPPSTTARQ